MRQRLPLDKVGLSRREFLLLCMPTVLAACQLFHSLQFKFGPLVDLVETLDDTPPDDSDPFFEAMINVRHNSHGDCRDLTRKALLLTGGNIDENNHLAFFLEALIWHDFLVYVLNVPKTQVRVLYFNGQRPSEECILEKCHCDLQRQQAKEILENYKINSIPIHGSITRGEILNELEFLAEAKVDRTLVISVVHGIVDVVKNTSLPQGGDLSSAWIVLDGLVHDYEFTEVLEGNRGSQVITFQANCASRYFLDQTRRIYNLGVFTSNGEGNRGEIAQLNTLSNWCVAVRYVLLNAMRFDQNSDGALSFLETQQAILGLEMPDLLSICHPLTGHCSAVHPGMRIGRELNSDDPLLKYRQN
jgi:hypothetical protein